MDRQKIDIPLDGAERPRDLPLDRETDAAITSEELALVNRHHEAYKKTRRRAQGEEGT
ncbi:hypothetical protein [uncultured Subdoligranulum sp.]|uniref:hypothetical protein n=1 Tax=uncultured Subdoligranulum sp. TaxID=512298 RepID=UPI00260D1A06|nr:hypothetical protein [uncultured Subdoligranulum sp.]